MGNYKFRLSDMISGTWLRKFKHSNTTSSTQKSLLPSDHNKDRWFLREVLAPTPHRTPSPLDHAHRRKSYHFPRKFQVVQPIRPLTPPRGSISKPRRLASLKRPTRCSSPRLVKTSVSACCSCRAFTSFDLMQAKPGCPVPASPPDSPFLTTAICLQSPPLRSVLSLELIDQLVSCKTTTSICRCRGNFDHSTTVARGLDRDPLSELELPPVITKSREFNKMVTSSRKGGENKKPVATDNSRNSGSRSRSSSSILVKTVKGETCSWMVWANNKKQKPRPIVNLATSPVGGMSLRVNSPKVGSRKQSQVHHPGRKSGKVSLSPRPVTSLGPRTRRSGGASDGFAVVKTSANPWKDFRESMVEMIVENDIRALKDLEDLLACYLKLNSDEYHDVIIGVFKEIWFDFSHVQSE